MNNFMIALLLIVGVLLVISTLFAYTEISTYWYEEVSRMSKEDSKVQDLAATLLEKGYLTEKDLWALSKLYRRRRLERELNDDNR